MFAFEITLIFQKADTIIFIKYLKSLYGGNDD